MAADQWRGGADVIVTNPYGPLPPQLRAKPALISLYHPRGASRTTRIGDATRWLNDRSLHNISDWGESRRNTFYVCGLPPRYCRLEAYREEHDPLIPNVGWFNLGMIVELLTLYADLIPPGSTVWDGFCGRGTVGVACHKLGLNYIGLDIDPERVEIARLFLAQHGAL